MKLRLLPRQEDAYFGVFQAAADTIAAATTALVDLLSDLADPETKAKQLAELEHEGDRITRSILTRLASTFIARLDRAVSPTEAATAPTAGRRPAAVGVSATTTSTRPSMTAPGSRSARSCPMRPAGPQPASWSRRPGSSPSMGSGSSEG